MTVAPWVRDIIEKHFKSSMEVGKTLQHPDGRKVLVIDGRFWGEHGVSNFWYWREVREDGSLGPKESGYGW